MAFDLSMKTASVLSNFRFGLLGIFEVGVEGNQRTATVRNPNDELTFRAAGAMPRGRHGAALDRQPGADQAGSCTIDHVDHGM
jgi:hypothetical protein